MSPVLLTSPDLRQSRLSQSVRQEDHSCSHPPGARPRTPITCGGPPRRRGRYPFRSYRRSHTQPRSVETFVGGGVRDSLRNLQILGGREAAHLIPPPPLRERSALVPGPSLAFVPVEDERAEREGGDDRKLPPPNRQPSAGRRTPERPRRTQMRRRRRWPGSIDPQARVPAAAARSPCDCTTRVVDGHHRNPPPPCAKRSAAALRETPPAGAPKGEI
jgi:hypothetical protein